MRRLASATLLAATLVLTGTGCSFDPNPRPDDGGVEQVGPTDDDREEPVSVERGTADDATLSLTGRASSITLGTDTDELLEVVATDPDSRPGIEQSDDTLVAALDGGAAVVRLADDVAWTVDLSAGAETVDADLSATSVAGIVLDGGARSIELTLPAPDGTSTIDQRAGADHLAIHLPDGVGARVTVTSGAGSVQIDGATTQGVGAGTVLTTDGFDEGGDHYDITVAGGLGSLTIDRV